MARHSTSRARAWPTRAAWWKRSSMGFGSPERSAFYGTASVAFRNPAVGDTFFRKCEHGPGSRIGRRPHLTRRLLGLLAASCLAAPVLAHAENVSGVYVS